MSLDVYFTKKRREEIGYFRKVNFLVKYFESLGFDTLNQTPLKISKEDVEVLRDRCNRVLLDYSLAEKLLPTTEGFFFGSAKYDEYYFDDVETVRNYIENELIPQFNSLEGEENIYFETRF